MLTPGFTLFVLGLSIGGLPGLRICFKGLNVKSCEGGGGDYVKINTRGEKMLLRARRCSYSSCHDTEKREEYQVMFSGVLTHPPAFAEGKPKAENVCRYIPIFRFVTFRCQTLADDSYNFTTARRTEPGTKYHMCDTLYTV